jgi:hypothetical protein
MYRYIVDALTADITNGRLAARAAVADSPGVGESAWHRPHDRRTGAHQSACGWIARNADLEFTTMTTTKSRFANCRRTTRT